MKKECKCGIIVIAILLLTTVIVCTNITKSPKCADTACGTTSQIANPASVYCGEHNGTLEIKTNPDGSQYGMCKFANGTECEEWKFFRGEC